MEYQSILFTTKDFYQAAILMTQGLQLQQLERGNHKFVNFVFSDPDYLAENIIEGYWADQIQVNPKLLISNIKELKNRLHSGY